MSEVKLIDIKETIFAENVVSAKTVRDRLSEHGVFMLNLMASPGAGKTSLILKTIDILSDKYRMAVIEGDIESTIDSEKISAKGIPAVQLRTGGACHLDATMVGAALDMLDLSNLDIIIVENIGNLVCPASFDLGARKNVLITSVPEGDDKVLKYPIMFSACEVLIVNKIDYLPDPGFDIEALKTRVSNLNPSMTVLELSCRNDDGIEAWTDWLKHQVNDVKLSVQ